MRSGLLMADRYGFWGGELPTFYVDEFPGRPVGTAVNSQGRPWAARPEARRAPLVVEVFISEPWKGESFCRPVRAWVLGSLVPGAHAPGY